MDFDNVLYDYISHSLNIVNVQEFGFISSDKEYNKLTCFNIIYRMKDIYNTIMTDQQTENIISMYNNLKM